MDELDPYEFGIVVIGRTNGVDAIDASNRARVAIKRALLKEAATEPGITLPDPIESGTNTVAVANLFDVGSAARNGYLWVQVTSLAAHERGWDR